MLRDKRVRSTALLGPAGLIFGLMLIFGQIIGGLAKPSGQRITVAGKEGLIAGALRKGGVKIENVPNLEAGRKAIRDGKTPVVLAETSEGARLRVDLLTDPSEPKGQIAGAVVREAVERANVSRRDAVLQAAGIPKEAAEPVVLKREEVRSGSEGGAGEFIVSLLPYLIVVWAFYGGMASASDLVAGEKERQTLETLFLTPVPRWRLLLGKWGALAIICLLAAFSSLVGLLAYALLKPPGSEVILKGGLGITFGSTLLMLSMLAPLAAFFAGLLVWLSALAKNAREAQGFLTMASFVVLLPAMGNQFVGLTDFSRSAWLAWVPVMGAGVGVREALLGRLTLPFWAATVVVNVVLCAISLLLARRAFLAENVLNRV